MNNGIIPLVFDNPADYDKLDEGDELLITQAIESVKNRSFVLLNKTKNIKIKLKLECGDRQIKMLIAGGSLNAVAESKK